jgi:TonB family protein
VFEFARPGRSTNPLITSLLLHSLGALGLFTLHFTGGLVAIADRVQHVSLLSPFVTKVPPPISAARAAVRLPPRVFQALPSPSPLVNNAAITLESAPLAPAIDVATPILLIPDLPRAATPPAPAPKAVVRTAGFSTAESIPGPPRATITTRASGFGDSPEAPASAPVRRSITSGGFGDATVAAPLAPASAQPTRLAAFTPVEILNKPRPRYSDEARRLQIEGEVLVEMLFGASGRTRVLRVIRGLGHGLDENAIAAAGEIRFRPALRGGGPVDYAAVVHIVFQLAY